MWQKAGESVGRRGFVPANIHGQENGSSKAAVAGILSGVEDISINGSNKNVSPRKTASEPVSKSIYIYIYLSLCVWFA